MEFSFGGKEYKDLLESIRSMYGYDFTDYNEASVKRRITHFMSGHNIRSLGVLEDILRPDLHR